jgi:hypothetical protein
MESPFFGAIRRQAPRVENREDNAMKIEIEYCGR